MNLVTSLKDIEIELGTAINEELKPRRKEFYGAKQSK
jgi:hypothetical protein